MISSRMTQEYRRMNSEDGSTFRQWLAVNAIVGASLMTLIAIAAVFSDGNSKLANTARNEKAIHPTETK
jgi:predicted membrane-bound mannosyltransferase